MLTDEIRYTLFVPVGKFVSDSTMQHLNKITQQKKYSGKVASETP